LDAQKRVFASNKLILFDPQGLFPLHPLPHPPSFPPSLELKGLLVARVTGLEGLKWEPLTVSQQGKVLTKNRPEGKMREEVKRF
jgi:hypothetical protein